MIKLTSFEKQDINILCTLNKRANVFSYKDTVLQSPKMGNLTLWNCPFDYGINFYTHIVFF